MRDKGRVVYCENRDPPGGQGSGGRCAQRRAALAAFALATSAFLTASVALWYFINLAMSALVTPRALAISWAAVSTESQAGGVVQLLASEPAPYANGGHRDDPPPSEHVGVGMLVPCFSFCRCCHAVWMNGYKT